MQLKSRQLVLFILACVVLGFSNFSGASLLAIACLLQLSILLQEFALTKASQLAFFKLFLLGIPGLFFWGGTHSFVFIYLNEGSFLMALMAASLSFSLSLFLGFQLIFSNSYLAKNDFAVLPSLSEAFNAIKNEKSRLFKIAGLIFVFSFIPYLQEDWKIVFALTATLFYLNQSTLKKALAPT